ncbi:MAG: hypothetical protein KAS04_01650, partial [Candidatus Aenigmarchaeota archaeon]|nr:hypothetical protein [Candidatus Aenigmarchaeota archaeon]
MKNTIFALNTVHKQIAAMLIATILMWVAGAPAWMVSRAGAAQLVSVSDTLSDSDKNVVSNHTVRFTTSATGQLTAGETILISFSPFDIPNGGGMDYTEIDMTVGAVEQTMAAVAAGGSWGVTVDDAADTILITSGTSTIGVSTAVEIEIGTHATYQQTGGVQITNPNPGSPTSYPITIGGTMDDSGITRVAI